MPLFKIDKEKLKQIKGIPFNLEKDIQKLTEENLDIIFGLQFVKSEFSLNNLRIDTFSFDPQTKAFVIIEYKKDKNFSVVDQGFAYLSLMLNNKADFVLEYNESTDGSLKRAGVDWSQSRVIFISPSFTTYQREAINFKDLPIELWEITRYQNETVNFNKVKSEGAAESIRSISKGESPIEHVTSQVKVYTLDDHYQTSSEPVKNAFLELRDEIFNIDEGIEEKISRTMVSYYHGGKLMVAIDMMKPGIRLHFRKGKYKDVLDKIKHEGWGGYPEIYIKVNEIDSHSIKELKDLIFRAYNQD